MKFKSMLVLVTIFMFSSCKKNTSKILTDLKPNMSTIESLKLISKSSHREIKNVARDKYRNPIETLNFLGMSANMKVLEIAPGSGWYTEILAPFLYNQGQLTVAGFDPKAEREYYRKSYQKLNNKFDANKAIYGKVKQVIFDPKKDYVSPASFDAVLTFRNVHNWLSGGTAKEAFISFYKALKPGGILGLVEHRGNEEVSQDLKAKSGYVNEKYLITLAESVGFKLVEKSEVNANPKDTKNHPEGVWTLPPSLKLGNSDKAKYISIGESDRMTLKFIKP